MKLGFSLLFASIAILSIVTTARADSNSSVFDAADKYTVRIRTAIQYGLGEDSIGVSSGTGFVVDAKRGWILTNRHVVGESPSIVEVSPKDENFREVKKIYVDPYLDLAIVATDSFSAEQQANLACGVKLAKGHPVGAYGHPWGFEYTGTQGVVSGTTRNFGPEMLQTDAPINAGNSGGPLISLETGQVVGVSSAKIAEQGVDGMGFAVPVGEVCRILSLLRKGGDPSPPKLDATFYDLEDSTSIVVAEAFGAALELGLRRDDEIIAAGHPLTPVDGLHDLVRRLRGSLDDVRLRVRRDDKIIELRGKLEQHRVRRGITFSGLVLGPTNFRDLSLQNLNHDISVQNIVAGSRGHSSKIKYWDIIHRVNGIDIKGLEHLYVILSEVDEGDSVTLDFLRPFEDSHFFIPVRRELVAERPIWLDNDGSQKGFEVRVMWAESTADSGEDLGDERRRLRKLLHEIEDVDTELGDSAREDLATRTRQLLVAYPEIVVAGEKN